MKYNARQEPYRGVVYRPSSSASSSVRNRIHPASYIAQRPAGLPFRIPPLDNSQSSLDQPPRVNSDIPAPRDTIRTPVLPIESPSAQIVPSEAPVRYESHKEPHKWRPNGRVTDSVQIWLTSLLTPNCTLTALDPINLIDIDDFLGLLY